MQPKCLSVTALTENIAAKLPFYFYQFKGIPQATSITALTYSVAWISRQRRLSLFVITLRLLSFDEDCLSRIQGDVCALQQWMRQMGNLQALRLHFNHKKSFSYSIVLLLWHHSWISQNKFHSSAKEHDVRAYVCHLLTLCWITSTINV
jgi:hypothetical protein